MDFVLSNKLRRETTWLRISLFSYRHLELETWNVIVFCLVSVETLPGCVEAMSKPIENIK